MVLLRYYTINNQLCVETISPLHSMEEEFDWMERGEPTSWETFCGSERECIDYVLMNSFLTKRIIEREREVVSIHKRRSVRGQKNGFVLIRLPTLLKNGQVQRMQSDGELRGDQDVQHSRSRNRKSFILPPLW